MEILLEGSNHCVLPNMSDKSCLSQKIALGLCTKRSPRLSTLSFHAVLLWGPQSLDVTSISGGGSRS